MSTQEQEYTGRFAVGDRVVCTGDRLDGSWEGAEGTVIRVYHQKGGMMAPDRNVELVLFDDENDGKFDVQTKEGLAALGAQYEESGDPWLASSDEYEFETEQGIEDARERRGW